jgi:hypothetical protein
MAAVDAGARADVQQIVGRPDGVFVVLDDNHGIAEVAEDACRVLISRALSRWCSPMRRLIEHIQHALQPGADLGCQADALRFAAASVVALRSNVR